MPYAIGGIFSDETTPLLKCKYIWGFTNNPSKASSQEEIRLAKILQNRDIVFQTEWCTIQSESSAETKSWLMPTTRTSHDVSFFP
ncbi:hypothetical protein RUMHYD_03530 [Blautia hydrogenotrophica DSM 10507]|uniref:Uncharacterized protein n=1 Tax=Blautia hydrogenotrophica (strain DSM 10507 / JCM 14656 / S5a33) TaxID=476272 RepID=C0CRL6_BLAHS|nr:hypothetical protein RUMHYD_03530 [Blautia hydrogenotrophica DSM 10507]